MQLQNYAAGQWVAGTGKQAELLDASTGELIATTSSGGLDFGKLLHHARIAGSPPY
jgi:oxepin-CoA hydrolase/3-oxo-5,6-dehydrosuberyl-CoA semialdehyde dehydrogenase